MVVKRVRKIEGKDFFLVQGFIFYDHAEAEAQRWKKQGYLYRIIETKNGYALYIHAKKGAEKHGSWKKDVKKYRSAKLRL